MEDRPIRERLQDIRQLSHEFGGLEDIPEEALAALRYARQVNEDGDVRLIPLEKLSTDGIGAAIPIISPEQALLRENRRAPFERVSVDVITQASFLSTAPRALEQKLDRALGDIDLAMSYNDTEDSGLVFLPADSAVRIFAARTRELEGVIESDQKLYVYEGTLKEIYFSENVHKALSAFPRDESGSRLSYEDIDRLTDQESEAVWNQLERIKSKLTDIDELEASFAAGFDFLYIDTAYDNYTVDDLEAFSQDVIQTEPDQILHIPVTYAGHGDFKDGEVPAGTGFTLRRDEIARVLCEGKFPDVAARLAACEDIPQIRAMLKDALTNNGLSADYKAAEKAIKARSTVAQSKDEREQLNVELHRLRTAKKQDLRLLRGTAEYFELPRLFAQYAKARINSVQNTLKAEVQEGSISEIILDGRPDPKYDTNPGRISGDCTEGKPLPFLTNLPAHNIKIFKDGNYVGNIYMLKTTADKFPGTNEKPHPVWHLDAIQFPSYTINRADFVKQLVSGLAQQAAQEDVACITVNTSPHFISNYDYISRAVLAFLGAEKTDTIAYDQMEIPDEFADDVAAPADKLAVKFPEEVDGYSQFQGALDEYHYILWRNPEFHA